MELSNRSRLIQVSGQRLEQAPQSKQIVLLYAGISLALALLFSLADYLLGLAVSRTGGLQAMGTRAIFSAVQAVLPFVHTGIAMCLDLGYLSAMLRISRRQYASVRSLRLGFDRFWPLLRLTLLTSLIFLAIGTVSTYLSSLIFVMTPLSADFMAVLSSLLIEAPAEQLILDEAVYSQLVSTMLPMLAITFVIFLAAAAPVYYWYRMADFLLIDCPEKGAWAVLRESRRMMRGNCWNLLRLDLRLWWYYVPAFAIALLASGDLLLPMLGVTFPWSETFSYYLFYGLSLIAQMILTCALSNRVVTTYALAYDSLRPREPASQGVVLGNIFQI